MRLLRQFFSSLDWFLHRPWYVFLASVAVLFVSLIGPGGLWRLWDLHQSSLRLRHRIGAVDAEIAQLKMLIVKASDPRFLELEARDRFDLASQGDLIFVFTDSEDPDKQGEVERGNP